MSAVELYHYCPRSYFPKIAGSGTLRPSAVGGSSRERPAVWFTSRPTYEPIALKLFGPPGVKPYQMGLEEQERRLGLARIVVSEEVAPLRWADWARESGVRSAVAKRMARRARDVGSDVSLYRATFEAVPEEAWARVEVWEDGLWAPASAFAPGG